MLTYYKFRACRGITSTTGRIARKGSCRNAPAPASDLFADGDSSADLPVKLDGSWYPVCRETTLSNLLHGGNKFRGRNNQLSDDCRPGTD